MATRAALRTRLQSRLGLGVVSAVELVRLNEALNSGLARALSDGVPGLTYETFVGATLGTLSLSGAPAVVVGSNVVTITGNNALTSNVYPHDILVVIDSAGATTKFLIRDVLTATTLDVGANATVAITGTSSSYVIRRAVMLPNSGQVSSVGRLSGSNAKWLSKATSAAKRSPFDTGNGAHYEQRYSEVQGKSFVSIWPAPDDATERFLLMQTEFKVQMDEDADTLAFPEEALDGVLERARQAYLNWVGADGVQLQAASIASRDVADSLQNSSNSLQTFSKF